MKKALIALAAFSQLAVAQAAEPYVFKTIECRGTLAPGRSLLPDFGHLALKIVYGPHTITDILGQTSTRDLSWAYSFSSNQADADEKLQNGNSVGFDSPGLTQEQEAGQTVVKYINRHYGEEVLRLTVEEGGGLAGVFHNLEDTYDLRCLVTKVITNWPTRVWDGLARAPHRYWKTRLVCSR